MKNDINNLASDIKFKSSEELFKDTFRHFKDGMSYETSNLFLDHNKRDTGAHKEDMAILYDNAPILNDDRFSKLLHFFECDNKPFYSLACSCQYIYLYQKMSDTFETISKAESESYIYDLVEKIIFYKNIANFKMAIENIGIRGEEYAKTKFVSIPES